MKSVFVSLGSCCAFIGVALGAFGAHHLKATLSPEALAVYQTGITYQMWHALGLIGIGLIQNQAQNRMQDLKALNWAGWLMLCGIVLFSGSLYLLALSGIHWLGMITPFGGICFLIAWLLLCYSAYTKKTTNRYQ